MKKGWLIKSSGEKGKGLFALRDFKKGEAVTIWHPKKIVSDEELKSLSQSEQDHATPTGDGRYLIMGVPERYVNHSCDPNTYVKDRKDIAFRKIKKGEEITSDYAINGTDDWKLNCKCGSKNCRKIVYGDFFKLSEELQRKYLSYLEDWFKKKFESKLEILK